MAEPNHSCTLAVDDDALIRMDLIEAGSEVMDVHMPGVERACAARLIG